MDNQGQKEHSGETESLQKVRLFQLVLILEKGTCSLVCHYRKRESRVLTVNLEVNLEKF